MVSIIIPNYNYSRFLKKRLHSILTQTYQNYEILFLDDASSDNSLSVAEKWLKKSNNPRKIYENERNSGSVFKQWQKGISMAKGDYIWIAESDDACHRTFLERTTNVIRENPSVGIVYTDSLLINENNYIISKDFFRKHYSPIHPQKWNQDYINKGMDEILNALFVMNTIPNASGVLFRKDILCKAVENANQYRLSGDWYTYLNVLKSSDIAYVSDKLNYNRFHQKRVTESLHTNSTYFEESLDIAASLLKEYTIPRVTQQKYLNNLFRQLTISNKSTILNKTILTKMTSLFSEELVHEALISRFNQLVRETAGPIKLLLRLKRITPQKVFQKCIRTKI